MQRIVDNAVVKLALGSCLFLVLSCTQTTAPTLGNPNAQFHGTLTMVDSTGKNPRIASISIRQDNSNNLTGEWANPGDRIHPLTGTISNGKVSINLSPDFDDSNTFLTGDFDGNSIRGKWIWSGFGGPMDWGTFTIVTSWPVILTSRVGGLSATSE